jgi:hypothetical protein
LNIIFITYHRGVAYDRCMYYAFAKQRKASGVDLLMQYKNFVWPPSNKIKMDKWSEVESGKDFKYYTVTSKYSLQFSYLFIQVTYHKSNCSRTVAQHSSFCS